MTVDTIQLDYLRQQRLGFDEAIFCLNKTPEQIIAIIEHTQQRNDTLLLSRLDADQYAVLPAAVRAALDYDALSASAFLGEIAQPSAAARVAVVTAGSSDAGVAREAVRTLYYYGHACTEIYDVGVAGLWRLLERAEDIAGHVVVIAVAGMDAALPSVLGGLVPAVVIAVPTSTGYGVAAGGQTALNAILASCAPGVAVVNIDNGYGAACAALRVLNIERLSGKPNSL